MPHDCCIVGAITPGDGSVVSAQFEHCDPPGDCHEKQTVLVGMISRFLFNDFMSYMLDSNCRSRLLSSHKLS